MVFGTFDGLHPGHLNFFQQAKNLSQNPFLIVSVARDKNVRRIKNKKPQFSARKRMFLVKKTKIADKIVLGGNKSHLPHIIKERPDVVALGYDQKYYVKNLKEDLKKNGLEVKIIRLKPFRAKIYKNHLLKLKNKN